LKKLITLNIRAVDRKTWFKFRQLCLARGKSASEMIRELLAKFVDMNS